MIATGAQRQLYAVSFDKPISDTERRGGEGQSLWLSRVQLQLPDEKGEVLGNPGNIRQETKHGNSYYNSGIRCDKGSFGSSQRMQNGVRV